MESTRNRDKLMLRRAPGETATVVLQFPKPDADRLRSTAAAIQFEGRLTPLSLFARRSVAVYLDALDDARINEPDRYKGELATLRGMLTATRRPARKRKAPAA